MVTQTGTGKKPVYIIPDSEYLKIDELATKSNFSLRALLLFSQEAPFLYHLVHQLYYEKKNFFLPYYLPFVNLINYLFTYFVICNRVRPLGFRQELTVSSKKELESKLREFIKQSLIVNHPALMKEDLAEDLWQTLNGLACADIVCPLAQLDKILEERDAADCLRLFLTAYNHFTNA